ncbi:G-type lectin S-receptor-like serine/threonine-protein kinase, partial [Trifolium pratense]
MFSKHFATIFFLVFLSLTSHSIAGDTTSWIKAGYHYSGNENSASTIKSTLFTHLLCAFAFINSTNYNIFINSSEEQKFSTFTNTVKLQNPSVTTLLSIYAGTENSTVFNSIINNSSHRKTFIDSSINTARKYEFQGIDLCGVLPMQGKELANLATLLKELRIAITYDARKTKNPELVLVMAGYYIKASDSVSYPFESMQKNLDWVHFIAYDYDLPKVENITGFHAALYGLSGWDNTDSGIKEWRKRGFSSNKLVIGLPYHGYAWTLAKRGEGGAGKLASGPAVTVEATSTYWINFDDVEAIKEKVSYAKKNGLLGYNVFQVGNDYNWVLSKAAHEVYEDHDNRRLLIIVLVTTLTTAFLLGTVSTITRMIYKLRIYLSAAEEDLDENCSDLIIFSYLAIKVATDNFSEENKLGEGGFGAVYK